jgi:hypothetical protein
MPETAVFRSVPWLFAMASGDTRTNTSSSEPRPLPSPGPRQEPEFPATARRPGRSRAEQPHGFVAHLEALGIVLGCHGLAHLQRWLTRWPRATLPWMATTTSGSFPAGFGGKATMAIGPSVRRAFTSASGAFSESRNDLRWAALSKGKRQGLGDGVHAVEGAIQIRDHGAAQGDLPSLRRRFDG